MYIKVSRLRHSSSKYVPTKTEFSTCPGVDYNYEWFLINKDKIDDYEKYIKEEQPFITGYLIRMNYFDYFSQVYRICII